MTRWVEAQACERATAWDIGKFIIENIVSRHGAPIKLLSDRGSQFRARISQAIFEIMNIKHVTTTSYHPEFNELTERFHKNLAVMLSMFTSRDQADWDRGLSLLIFAYNTSVQDSTNFTPFELVSGREARLPVDVVMNVPSFGVESTDIYFSSLSDSFGRKSRSCKI